MNDTLLRPRSAVEIIDAGFALYRANFTVLAPLALILLGPFEVVGALVGGDAGSLISSLSGLFGPIVVGATVAVISDAMHGRETSIGSAFGQIAGRWGTLVLVSLAQGLLVLLGLIFLIVPGVMALVWTFAAPMVVVAERETRASAALGRSRQLARGQFGHVLGTLALAWLLLVVLILGVGVVTGFVTRFAGLTEDMSGFLASWAMILLMPIVGAASSVLYFDLRVRRDAYDIEQLAASVGRQDETHTGGAG
jgi:hypothetical protein